MSDMDSISDGDLIVKARAARENAHTAPKCIRGPEDAPYVQGDAWARHTNELLRFVTEIERRGLSRALVFDASLRTR